MRGRLFVVAVNRVGGKSGDAHGNVLGALRAVQHPLRQHEVSAAQAFYTQLGDRVVKENPSTLQNEAGRVADHRRMVLEL